MVRIGLSVLDAHRGLAPAPGDGGRRADSAARTARTAPIALLPYASLAPRAGNGNGHDRAIDEYHSVQTRTSEVTASKVRAGRRARSVSSQRSRAARDHELALHDRE